MDYIKIRFASDFDQIGSKSGRIVEDMFRSMLPLFTLSERTLEPQIDVYETQKEIHILTEVAGVEEENLEVEISRKTITISGHRSQMRHTQKGTYRLAEIQYGPFERTLVLPVLIDTEKVTATYINGLLHVRLAKISRDQTYEIPISDG